jgi:DHA2 family multidrug resistance protein-like MFS transporter
MDAAREAFVQGLHVTAWLGTVLLVYTGLQAIFLLQRKTNSVVRS